MNNASNNIKSLYALIEYSTDFRFKQRADFKQLHTSLIKKYFNVSSVVIDSQYQKVYLGIDAIEKGVEVSVDFKNFSKFLKSCVRNTSGNQEFYSNILHYYNQNEAVA